MTVVAVLPIKAFERAKQRLAERLEPTERRALVEAMFSDALVALRRARRLDEIVVVTSYHPAQRIAIGYGAQVVEDDEEGHSQAAMRGVERALELGADRVLLVPGDCPLLAADELDGLVGRAEAGADPSVLIVPDRHGTGTNALLLTPPGAIEPAFGPGSAERHRRLAREKGTAVETVELQTLGLDIDTADDLAAVEATLAVSHGGAAHTRGMLRQLLRSRV